MIKVISGSKFMILKKQKPQNLIEYFLLFFASTILMWFPVFYNGNDVKIKQLKKKINLTTYLLYTLALSLIIVVFIQIYQIRNP